jgi:hypothetical protein
MWFCILVEKWLTLVAIYLSASPLLVCIGFQDVAWKRRIIKAYGPLQELSLAISGT